MISSIDPRACLGCSSAAIGGKAVSPCLWWFGGDACYMCHKKDKGERCGSCGLSVVVNLFQISSSL